MVLRQLPTCHHLERILRLTRGQRFGAQSICLVQSVTVLNNSGQCENGDTVDTPMILICVLEFAIRAIYAMSLFIHSTFSYALATDRNLLERPGLRYHCITHLTP